MIYFNLESKIQELVLGLVKPVSERQGTQFAELEKLKLAQARAHADVQDLQVALKRSARLEAELEALDDAIGEQVSALDYFTNS